MSEPLNDEEMVLIREALHKHPQLLSGVVLRVLDEIIDLRSRLPVAEARAEAAERERDNLSAEVARQRKAVSVGLAAQVHFLNAERVFLDLTARVTATESERDAARSDALRYLADCHAAQSDLAAARKALGDLQREIVREDEAADDDAMMAADALEGLAVRARQDLGG